MTVRSLGVALNGVTGRMGHRQHLVRSILAIRKDGGVPLPDGTRIMPEPVLVGRDAGRLAALADTYGLPRWSTDLAAVLADDTVEVYFDTQVTAAREEAVAAAVAAGKHVYAEKPTATTAAGAAALAEAAAAAGVRSGVVMDKLYLPGLAKLRRLVDSGFFGRVLSVRGEFGYWVFEGDWQSAQRPSWNYRSGLGGGLALDMFPHWHYVLENLFGAVTAVTARVTTHLPERVDERGERYAVDVDDGAYGIFELAGGAIAQINSSWCTRVNRDELLEFQVDGTHGSAVAGLRRCRTQHRVQTPKPVWNPDVDVAESFRDQWQEVPDNAEFGNAFRAEWEEFLRSVVTGEPFAHDLAAAARGVALAEAGLRSSAEGRRIELT